MFKKKPNKDLLFVSFQVLLFIFYFTLPPFYSFELNRLLRHLILIFALLGIGQSLLAIVQLNRNLSPFPTPLRDGELIKTGIFKFVRHPIYGGIILFTSGYAVSSQNVSKILIACILWCLFYFKSKYEESLLLKRYPDYENYRNKTARFFPFL